MQTKKLCTLVLSATMISTLVVGCGKKPTSTSESSSQSDSSSKIQQEVILSAVDQKAEFVEFLSNRNKSSTQADGFLDNTKAYSVGDDNAFNVKPELTVLDAETYLPVSSSRWTYEFEITAKMDGGSTNVDSTYFSVVDPVNADVKFTEAAIGHSFKIQVVPTHIEASKTATFTKAFDVEVVDGYNVYNAKELGYFDTRAADSTEGEEDSLTALGFVNKWHEFKAANGMDPNLKPSALIMHEDLKITTKDFPSNLVYTAEEAAALSDTKAAGTLKDRSAIYKHITDGNITLNGNYFGLDVSEVPLIVRDNNNTTAVGEVVSHGALFRTDKGSSTFLNLKLTGNAPRAEKDEDTVYGGGLIFLKATRQSTAATLDNMIARDSFITVMTERPDDGFDVITLEFSNAKCSNNYNSFIYSWGGRVTATNSSFSNCGGPIIIQDHWASGDSNYDAYNGLLVNGYRPEVSFINCELNNFVAGSEAWFQQFHATALIPQIKAMSDLYYAAEIGKGFLVDQNHHATVYQTAGDASFFNFIVLNKSSAAEGITNYPVCGKVTIRNDAKESVFDYRQPNNDPVGQAYLAYAVDSSDANLQALIAAALANGIELASDYSDLQDKVNEYLTAVCTPHGIIRGLNTSGAPVFDLGGDLPLGTTDGATPTMLDATIFAGTGGATKQAIALSDAQKANLGDYTTIYYNGMALVFALYSYGA